MTQVAILIPAAGASSRMRGGDKLLEPVAGTPLLARQTALAVATGARVLVTLRPGDDGRKASLDGIAPLDCKVVPDADEGMAASVRAGALWATGIEATGLMVLLPDLPDIDADDLALMMAAADAHPDRILRATDIDGAPGHPVIFPHRVFAALSGLKGDAGARDLMKNDRPERVVLPDHHATTDLDTPEDWARWRARTGL